MKLIPTFSFLKNSNSLNKFRINTRLVMIKNTNRSEVNTLFKIASENELKGILGIEFNPLVSIDFLNDTRSSIIDAQSTLVTDNNLLKVYSWYDNETGYACRMNDIVKLVHNSLNV